MKVRYPKIILGGVALALVATLGLASCGPSATESALQTQNALLQQQNNQLQNKNERLQDKLDTRPAPVIVPPVYVPPPILLPPALVPYPQPIRPWFPGWHWPNWHRPHGPIPYYGPHPVPGYGHIPENDGPGPYPHGPGLPF